MAANQKATRSSSAKSRKQSRVDLPARVSAGWALAGAPRRGAARWVTLCFATFIPLFSHASTQVPMDPEGPAPAAPEPAVLDRTLDPSPRAEVAKDPTGTPQVRLNRLDFPDVPGAAGHRKHLERFLKKEARRMRWGGGRQNRIEYRFEVTELRLEVRQGVLQVHCSAVGRLPGNRSARSQLSFGGDPARETQVVRQVLEIVGRGVLTRLAELERQRRGLD
jgi:hypothetical protein